MLRSLSLAALAAVVLVPLSAVPASAQTAGDAVQAAPMSGSVWKSSASRRRAPRTTVPVTAAVTAPRTTAPTAAQAYQDRVLALTNAQRTRRGLRALRLSTCADRYADRWAGSLRAAGTLSHQPLSPILSACSARGVGENVAVGKVTPEQLVAMWMASPGHRANILTSTFTHLGVGAVSTSTGRWYGVQVFLRA